MARLRTWLFFIVACFVLAARGPLGAEEKAEKAARPEPPPVREYVSTTHIPGPHRVLPAQDTVDLTGRMFMDFRWEPSSSPYHVWYYDFHLYKGYDTTAVREIFAKRVSGLSAAVSVRADYFKDGESYTWSVVQVDAGPRFSAPVYHTFRVIKKPEKTAYGRR
ncbi:MAG: hypothetical protein PHS61_04375 [Candidatus Omnitrophica bacterium]|nr:hypothetical protein [Candidatus Omnitrophota bacterium]